MGNQQTPFTFSDNDRHLILSSSAIAVYRVHNSGPGQLNVFLGTAVDPKVILEPHQSIDVGASTIEVQLVAGQPLTSGWYQFVTLPTG